MSSLVPSRRPSIRPAQLERCQICSRLRDNAELRESIAHPGLYACADHPDEFVMGYREYQREGIGPIVGDADIVTREEPIGGDLGIFELGSELP